MRSWLACRLGWVKKREDKSVCELMAPKGPTYIHATVRRVDANSCRTGKNAEPRRRLSLLTLLSRLGPRGNVRGRLEY